MFVVAAGELVRGTPATEVHLITPSPLVQVTSTVTPAGQGYHHSTITEAIYHEPAASAPLPQDGVTHPIYR